MNDCLNRLKLKENINLAVGGSRQHILNSKTYSPSEIFCFEPTERVENYGISFLMRDDFYLLTDVNRIIQNLIENGLIVKWQKDSQRRSNQDIPYVQPSELQLKHINSANFVLALGFLLALSVICFECLISWRMKVECPSRRWIYCEILIDGKRHLFKNLPERLQRSRRAE